MLSTLHSFKIELFIYLINFLGVVGILSFGIIPVRLFF